MCFCLLQFRVAVDVTQNVTSCSAGSVPITTEPFGGLFIVNSNRRVSSASPEKKFCTNMWGRSITVVACSKGAENDALKKSRDKELNVDGVLLPTDLCTSPAVRAELIQS